MVLISDSWMKGSKWVRKKNEKRNFIRKIREIRKQLSRITIKVLSVWLLKPTPIVDQTEERERERGKMLFFLLFVSLYKRIEKNQGNQDLEHSIWIIRNFSLGFFALFLSRSIYLFILISVIQFYWFISSFPIIICFSLLVWYWWSTRILLWKKKVDACDHNAFPSNMNY